MRQVSLAAQVEQILAERLRDLDLRPGDQLPAENELAAEFGVSRATLRTAINSLVRRGLVVQRHGVGNFVAGGALLTNDLTEAVDLTALLERSGVAVDIEFDDVSLIPATTHVAHALAIDPAAAVLRSAKRFCADGQALIYVVNSIPEAVLGVELAARAVDDPGITEPLFAFLEESVGVTTAYQLASVSAELGPNVRYPGADLGPQVAALCFEEVGYTEANAPIWHSTTWYPPSPMRFELVRHRSGRAP